MLQSIDFRACLFSYEPLSLSGRKEFRRLLLKFNIDVTDDDYEKLWRKYDTNDSGEIDYHEFLHTFGKAVQENTAPAMVNDSSRFIPLRLKGAMGTKNIEKVMAMIREGEENAKRNQKLPMTKHPKPTLNVINKELRVPKAELKAAVKQLGVPLSAAQVRLDLDLT